MDLALNSNSAERASYRRSLLDQIKKMVHVASESSEDSQEELEQLVNRLRENEKYSLLKYQPFERKSWVGTCANVTQSFNIMPSTTVKGYLKKIHYAKSSSEALARDWDKVGEDVWVGMAEFLTEEKTKGI